LITVLSIVGTRPEAIKMAPVVRELARRDSVRSLLCGTGQHREMLSQVFDCFELRPDFDLAVMRPNQSLAGLTARLLEGLDEIVQETRPDFILAQGDTTTVLAASLISYYHRIPFGHVEAGLRTGDKWRPFPEEMNRCIADKLADLYFAPTEFGRQALLREGVPDAAIHVTGNTVVDALQAIAAQPYDWEQGPLRDLPQDRRWVLITAHRRESFGAVFEGMCRAFRELAVRFHEHGVHFIYPVHLNPNVREPVFAQLAGLPNMSLVDPLDYPSLVHLMKRCVLALSDSGGIQEEAPSLKLPLLVLRDTTERPEGVEAGVARLIGTDPEQIIAQASRLLTSESARKAMSATANPYGDGRAAQRIVDVLTATHSSSPK
jgi:UDP-N-acetylglucosamine 2-epimerase